MDLMHYGLEHNPIRAGKNDGYVTRVNREPIADKCYALAVDSSFFEDFMKLPFDCWGVFTVESED